MADKTNNGAVDKKLQTKDLDLFKDALLAERPWMFPFDEYAMHKIIDGLYLSNFDVASKRALIVQNKIGLIINATNDLPNVFESETQEHDSKQALSVTPVYVRVPVMDWTGEDISRYFESTCKTIDTCLSKQVNVLVHCHAGVSRSPTLVLAYLIWKNKCSMAKALSDVKQIRRCVDPNDGFVERLKQWHKQCTADGSSPKQSLTPVVDTVNEPDYISDDEDQFSWW